MLRPSNGSLSLASEEQSFERVWKGVQEGHVPRLPPTHVFGGTV